MKAVLIGGGSLSVATAKILTERGHDVVIVERNAEKIDVLSEQVDCGFINGDGTKPGILRESGPSDSDLLLCLTNNDQTNMLASLVGRSLGFPRVVTKIDDPEFEHICIELSLTDTIIPDRQVARELADMLQGQEPLDLSTYFKGEVRLFSFIAGEQDEMPIGELGLPDRCRVMCVYRGDDFLLPDAGTRLTRGDQVVLITHSRNLEALRARWQVPA